MAQKLNQFGMTNFELVSFDLRFINQYLFAFIYGSIFSICFYFIMTLDSKQLKSTVLAFIAGCAWSDEITYPIQEVKLKKVTISDLINHFFYTFLLSIILYVITGILWADITQQRRFLVCILLSTFYLLKLLFESKKYTEQSSLFQRYSSDFFVKILIAMVILSGVYILDYLIQWDFNGLISLFMQYFPYNLISTIIFLSVTSIFAHYLIRTILYVKGVLPFKFVKFFNFLTKKRILEYEFGTWRFRHKIIQDYFAKMDIEKFLKKEE